MTLTRRFFSAPTLTQALLTAARYHGVEPEALAYNEVEKKHGFVKKPRGVVIEVDPDAPLRPADESEAAAAQQRPPAAEERQRPAATTPPPQAPKPAASEPSDPVEAGTVEKAAEEARAEGVSSDEPPADEPPAEDASAEEAPPEEAPAGETEDESDEPEKARAPGRPRAREAEERGAAEPEEAGDQEEDEEAHGEEVAEPVAEELRLAVARGIDELAHLAGLRVQATQIRRLEDGLAVDLEGPDASKVTALGGRSLLAIQHLLPRLLFGELGRIVHCRVDCDGFHQERRERLERVAHKAAERVRSGGRSWLLEPMAPDERRLVHLALAGEPDVETRSVGEGFLKRVRVARTEEPDPAD